MSVEYIGEQDIFQTRAEVLVNPVNTVGIMGAGLALQFRHRYPQMFMTYAAACESGVVEDKACFIYYDTNVIVFNAATKHHWKEKSDIDLIRRSLKALAHLCVVEDIKTVAVPRLGAGLGGLHWPDVAQVIEEELASLEIQTSFWILAKSPKD